MESLTKDFKKIEMDIARYIFKKYISISITSSSSTNAATVDASISESDNVQAEIDLELGMNHNDENSDTSDSEVNDIIEPNEPNESNELNKDNIDERIERGIHNNKEYKKYFKTIFHRDRTTGVLNQITELKKDLDDMAKADSAYTRNADKFNPTLYDSLPDVMRCTYIRKHHHRYYRCKNKIANDDSDVCKKHLECENIYFDNYNDLVESITSK
jgi:hypothetical protein